MRHLFFILALFTAFAITAQEQPDSTTTSVENRAGVFFSISTIYYPSGRIVTDQVPIGDTTAAANAIIGGAFSELTQFAEKAVTVARIAKARQLINQTSQSLQSVVGQTYFDVMDNLLSREFLPDSLTTVNYNMRVNGNSPINVSLRRNAAGSLVMRQGSTNFRVEIITRNWIRIRQYDGSNTATTDPAVRLDLYQERPGRWISLDLRYVFTRQ